MDKFPLPVFRLEHPHLGVRRYGPPAISAPDRKILAQTQKTIFADDRIKQKYFLPLKLYQSWLVIHLGSAFLATTIDLISPFRCRNPTTWEEPRYTGGEEWATLASLTSPGRLQVFWIASPALPVCNDEQMIPSECMIWSAINQ